MNSENKSYSGAVSRFITSFIIVAALLVLSNSGCNSNKQHAHHGGSISTADECSSECEKSPVILFGKDNKVLVRYSPSNQETSYTVPDTVTHIARGAFMECKRLKSVTIGKGVTSIGEAAFSECSNLRSIVIPESVTSIGSGAFYRCSSLTEVYFEGNATKLPEENAFFAPSVIHYKPGTTGWTNPWDGRPTKEWVE